MVVLLDSPSVIGIIVAIALVAVNLAVCIYLYALRNKPSSDEETPSGDEDGAHQ